MHIRSTDHGPPFTGAAGGPLTMRVPPHALALARRLIFVALVAATVAAFAVALAGMFRVNGMSPLEWPILFLTVLLLVPLALSFWMAVLGFVVELRGRDPLALDVAATAAEGRPLGARTAIVVPVYHEDPERVVAGLDATLASLDKTGQLDAFDVFVLSDTTDPRKWIEEELAIRRFRDALPWPGRLRYRNRRENVERKAGNIAEFCRRWGDDYRYMIVFDADSVMSGASLVRLVRLMERHPEAGIIQAPPVPVNRRTLFGRVQQFAARAYGPTWAAGLRYLQAGEGNYYGHNAIIRIAPFVQHCRLPRLSGPEPLGGPILSHDFVEAALMRRAGFRVYLAADLGGSYEEPPPTLVDYAIRDRRWCQGNLQHARLLTMPGLHLVSRLHLLMGVMAYVASPLWILLLLLGTVEALRVHLGEFEYFAPEGSLFPMWRRSIEHQALLIFGTVFVVLLLPKGLALVARMRSREERRSFGGAARLALGALAEFLFSVLLAPTLAVLHSIFVLGILAGGNTGWKAQQRGDRGTSLREALRRHTGTTVFGLVWAWLLHEYAPDAFWWTVPVLAGLVLSIPLSMWSSRVGAGEWFKRRGVLLTPEEVDPPPVLRRLQAALAGASPPAVAAQSALARLLADPEALATHLSFLKDASTGASRDPLEAHELEGLLLRCRLRGADALSDAEQRRVLLEADLLLAISRSGEEGA